eukprot:2812819-Rhodomonas_salina.1
MIVTSSVIVRFPKSMKSSTPSSTTPCSLGHALQSATLVRDAPLPKKDCGKSASGQLQLHPGRAEVVVGATVVVDDDVVGAGVLEEDV